MSAINPLIIPLAPVNSQTLDVTLGGQPCTINVYTKTINVPSWFPMEIITIPPNYLTINPIFLDLYLNNVLVLGGVLCNDQTLIVRNTYFGFIGDLMFVDTTGAGTNPQVFGLGTQWILLYLPNEP